MARADLEFISNALAEAVESSYQGARIQRGVDLREAMYQALARGEQVNHYRLVWLSESVVKVIEYAKGLCGEFDQTHPNDIATALDLGDILRIASNQIQAKLPQEQVTVVEKQEGETTPT